MDSFDDTALALTKFGVGQPVPRMEDPTLLRGQGRYTDDQNLPNQAYAVMVRSKIAHGVLKGIDSKAASAMPGVLAILTYADIAAAGFGPMKCGLNIPQRDGSPMKTPPRHSLAKDRVRYVGEAVACVVAETAVQHRSAGYNFLMTSVWTDPAQTDANIAWSRQTYGALEPSFADRRYVNYLSQDDLGEAARAAYGANYDRLAQLKAAYDPENVFRLNLNVMPAAA